MPNLTSEERARVLMEKYGYLILGAAMPVYVGHVCQNISLQDVSQPFYVVGEANELEAQEQEDFIAPLEGREPICVMGLWPYLYRLTTD